MEKSIESALYGTNLTFVAELYARYLKNPQSVDSSWCSFFSQLGDDEVAVLQDLGGASWASASSSVVEPSATAPSNNIENTGREATLHSIRALMLVRAYRVRGHLNASCDPLGLEAKEIHPELDYRSYGFSDADLDESIFIDHVLGLECATLREIIQILQETYCGNIGVEFLHIQDPDQKSWIQCRIEGIHNQTSFTEKGKRAILERLVEAEGFE